LTSDPNSRPYIALPFVPHGGDYNPDQWPETVWDDDVRLMQEANVNIATLPVFSWVKLQPDEDTFDFAWLDRVLEKLWAGGIHFCMATSTASVPAWMDQKYPDILRVGWDGVKVKHGHRHTFCPNSANFRRLATGLARRMAERYGDHPGLRIWHVSNEYGNTCYCDQCAAAFRVWLQARYGTLEDLQNFVMTFLRCRGSIREVERELGISYPTVCKRLDLVNALLGNSPAAEQQSVNPNVILGRLEAGEITAREAAQLLKGRTP